MAVQMVVHVLRDKGGRVEHMLTDTSGSFRCYCNNTLPVRQMLRGEICVWDDADQIQCRTCRTRFLQIRRFWENQKGENKG